MISNGDPMTTRQASGSIFAALLAASCGASVPPDPAQVWLVSEMYVPEPDLDNRMAGVDLDGRDDHVASELCTMRAGDGTSLYSPDEHGVDNVLARLLPHILHPPGPEPTMSDLIAIGRVAIGLRISVLGDAAGSVELQMGHARVVGCDAAVPMTCEPLLVDGHPAPHQTVSFEADGPIVHGRIVGGRLQAELGDVVMPAALVDAGGDAASQDLTLRQAQLDVSLSEDGLEGSIGGVITIQDMVALGATAWPEVSADEMRRGLEPWADFEPTAADASVCDALSIGLVVRGVRVEADE